MPEFFMHRVEPPGWATQPELRIDGVTVAEFDAIQRRRDEMLALVQREIEAYVNDPLLCFTGDGAEAIGNAKSSAIGAGPIAGTLIRRPKPESGSVFNAIQSVSGLRLS